MIQMTIIHAFATTSATVEIGRIFIAIAVVISASQIFGELLSRLSQPRVMGEILGGVALGPSLLGWLSPQLEDQLFGGGVTDQLNLLGQLGLALFMFLVGLELQPSILKGKAKVAAVISLSGIVLPMVMGIGLGTVLDGLEPTLFPGDRRLDGALFMGTAMAITAFPVLAYILRERMLIRQPLGALSLATASVDDVLSWVLLAAVVAFTRSGSIWECAIPLAKTAAWAFALLVLLRPFTTLVERHYNSRKGFSPFFEALILIGLLVSCVVTDAIGVHLIFGAFLWGLAMPRRQDMQDMVEARFQVIVVRLLLPMFFVVSGLQTELTQLGQLPLLLITASVLVVAVSGKFLGTWCSARLCGIPSREAQALGWLANTRGMTELIVLNVGLKLGVIGTTMFGIGVVMALTTTLMAGPLLTRLGYGRASTV